MLVFARSAREAGESGVPALAEPLRSLAHLQPARFVDEAAGRGTATTH